MTVVRGTPPGVLRPPRTVPPVSAASLAELLGQPAPTPEQAAVVAGPLASGLVVAGAGSGKTETMAGRVVYLVATRQLVPAHVMGLTFTRKAAAELAERITGRLARLYQVDPDLAAATPVEDRTTTVETYDGFAHSVVAEHGLRLGVEPGARLLRPAEAWQVADGVVRTWSGDFDDQDEPPGVDTVVEAVRSLHDQLATHRHAPVRLAEYLDGLLGWLSALPPEPTRLRKDGRPSARQPSEKDVREFRQRTTRRRRLVELVEQYRARLAAAGTVDFASIAAVAAELARDVPEVAEGQRRALRLVLLDEFQDTSPAQLDLVAGAFAGIAVTAVGDPHQSIYGWRGAGADTLGAFATRIGGDTATLSTSFRNSAPVLQAANTVAAPLAAATRVAVPVLRPRADAPPGRVQVALHRTDADEAQATVAVARDQLAGGRTVGVLVRTRRQVEPLLAALRRADVDVEVVGLGGLLGVPVVVEVVSVLQVLANPDRGDALMRLLTGARWRIGPRDLAALSQLSRRSRRDTSGAAAAPAPGSGPTITSTDPDDTATGAALSDLAVSDEPEPGIVDALDSLVDRPHAGAFSPVGRDRLRALATELRELRRRSDAPLGELIGDVVSTTGLGTELAASASGVAGSPADLAGFVEEAQRYSDSGRDRSSLPAFLAYLDVAERRERGLDRSGNEVPDEAADDPEADPDTAEVRPGRVQLLTVHAAKGLEWDAVVVPGMADRVFPSHPRVPKGWITDIGALPHPLRGDAESLPSLRLEGVADLGELRRELAEHANRMDQHRLAEERRLAYVAVTRARLLLVASAHRWTTGLKKAREVGTFLRELHELAGARSRAGDDGFDIGPWVDGDAGDPPVPALDPGTVWPRDLLDPDRGRVVAAAAAAVAAAAADLDALFPRGDGGPGEVSDEAAGWERDVDLLLAARGQPPTGLDVHLPGVVSVSGLVAVGRDPDGFALALRRPVPRRPRAATRLGTAFHAWLEQRWGAARLLDVEDLPGSADDTVGDGPLPDHAGLRHLQEAFEASAWAHRTPAEVEFPFAMPIGASDTGAAGTSGALAGPGEPGAGVPRRPGPARVVLRGRIDAVFRDERSGAVEVVDWKTGPPPATARQAREAAVQLAAYRLAWHRATGTPLKLISGAFHHVAAGVTVRPADLLDEAGLVGLVSSLPEASVSSLPEASVSSPPGVRSG